MDQSQLLEKLKQLPVAYQQEVEDFVDFILHKRLLTSDRRSVKRKLGLLKGKMQMSVDFDDEESIAKILALAEKLNVAIEMKDHDAAKSDRDAVKQRILNFKSGGSAPFGDAADWEREQRADDFFSIKDMWVGRNMTAAELRAEAWPKG